MPLYAKSHSQGEYIFDHNWAHAWERAGGSYYPKLQAAVPFTPATGRRFLTRPGHEAAGRAALLQGALTLARAARRRRACTSPSAPRRSAPGARRSGLLGRTTQQFHWQNRGYADFDGFLADLASRKRKAIRKERERAQAFGGEIVALTGDALEPAHWDAFWRFYQDTGSRKWGHPYLTRAFFDRVQAAMRDDVLLVLARRRRPLGGRGAELHRRDTLYGRYWGCSEDHPTACTSSSATTRRSTGRSRTACRGSRPARRASTSWRAATCRRRRTRCTGWPTPASPARSRSTSRAEARAVGEEIEVLTAYGPFRRGADPSEQD